LRSRTAPTVEQAEGTCNWTLTRKDDSNEKWVIVLTARAANLPFRLVVLWLADCCADVCVMAGGGAGAGVDTSGHFNLSRLGVQPPLAADDWHRDATNAARNNSSRIFVRRPACVPKLFDSHLEIADSATTINQFHFLNFPFCWPYKFTDDTGISAFPVGVELAAGRFRAVLEA
jgi:hypothetical protein